MILISAKKWDNRMTIPELAALNGMSHNQIRYIIKRDNMKFKRRFAPPPCHIRWYPDKGVTAAEPDHKAGSAWDDVSVYL